MFHIVAKHKFCDTCTVIERTLDGTSIGSTSGRIPIHGFQTCYRFERIITNTGGCFGYGQFRKRTTLKRRFTYPRNLFMQIDGSQFGAVLERIVFDLLQRIRNSYRLQVGAAFEGLKPSLSTTFVSPEHW